MNNCERSLIILGLNSTATKDEIKSAYHQMIMINHPDKCPDNVKNKANKQINLIKEAYEYLMNNFEKYQKNKIEDYNSFEEMAEEKIKKETEKDDNFERINNCKEFKALTIFIVQ